MPPAVDAQLRREAVRRSTLPPENEKRPRRAAAAADAAAVAAGQKVDAAAGDISITPAEPLFAF